MIKHELDVQNPFSLFDEWMKEAASSEPEDPSAACLALVGASGLPSARMVLLRGWGVDGFWFNTHSDSDKGRAMAANPYAALCLHWKTLRRQIRITGRIEVMDAATTDQYFAARPRYSQIGAWASKQSRPLGSMAALHAEVEAIARRYEGKTVPRPPSWRGYIVVPDSMEFWQQQDFRLHDRFIYKLDETGAWQAQRLYP